MAALSRTLGKRGIRCEVTPPAVVSRLPRMDVAGFVGFVSRVDAPDLAHTPVPVESAAEYQATFGPDPTLPGWRGLLGESVRAFFANGGRRAFVVGVPVSDLEPPDPARLVDPRLAELSASQLREEATRLASDDGAPRGLHALLDLDEVTVLCAPDAVAAPPAPQGGLRIQLSVEPLPPSETPPPAAPLPRRTFQPLEPTPRVEAPALPTPAWSPGELTRRLARGQPLEIAVSWGVSGAVCNYFELQISDDKLFSDPVPALERRTSPSATLPVPEGPRWLRVRGVVDPGGPGPWSATLHLRPEREPDGQTVASSGQVLALHRCLLRVAAARGDALALLSLPVELGPDGVLEHLAALPTRDDAALDGLRVPPWTWDEEARLPSFGALFHPWVAHVGRGAGVTPIPPDGPVAGLMARRTLGGGCWMAPANQDLVGALGVWTAVPDAAWERAEQPDSPILRLNRVANRGGGTRVMRASTLSDDADLGSLTTRRLLSLLRRLALREGQVWAFASPDAGTTTSVQAAFRGHMADLFQRGAFAGDAAAQAFDVAVRVSGQRDTPRIEVELRFAPALPTRFLTVRLTQLDPRGQLAVEG